MKAFLKTLIHLFKRIFGVHSKSFDCRVDINRDGIPDVIVSVKDCDDIITNNQDISHVKEINNKEE